MKIRYALADIEDDIVLGLNWLREMDPDISWKKETISWREDPRPAIVTVVTARKARKRMVQSEIAHNEPPDWVKRKHKKVMELAGKRYLMSLDLPNAYYNIFIRVLLFRIIIIAS